MTATITAGNGAGTVTPLDVLMPYRTGYESRNIVHDLIGGGIAVSLVPPRPRAGDLVLLFPDAVSADACAELHGQGTSFTLVETERPTIGMTYVVRGRGLIQVELEPGTRQEWTVTIPYQEVTP